MQSIKTQNPVELNVIKVEFKWYIEDVWMNKRSQDKMGKIEKYDFY